jgi:hypothetical protein
MVNKMFIMLPVMYAARKLDGEDPDVVFMLRCCYFGVQSLILLAVIYVFLASQKMAGNKKIKDVVIYVAPPPQPLADPNAKKQYKQTTFGEHITSTARSLLMSTVFGIIMTSGLHYYKGMIVGLAMQSIMGPFNLYENTLVKAILTGGVLKEGETPQSRKIFDEKYREELTDQDEVVDANNNTIVMKKEKKKDAKKIKAQEKSEPKSFEDTLLDTWDEGEEADISPVYNMLTKKNVNFQIKENGWSPLMIMSAINAKKADTAIQKMKTLGVDAAATDNEGWNALHWSAFHGSASGAKTLFETFGHADLIALKDLEGKTPLEHAIAEKNDDVAAVIKAAIGGDECASGLADQEGIRKRK